MFSGPGYIGPFPNTDYQPYDTMTQTENDPVDHPDHYKKGGIETIDVIEAKLSPEELQGYCIGNAIKYLTRRHYKGKPLEDVKKAHWYLTRALGLHLEVQVVPKGTPVDLTTEDPVQISTRECAKAGCPSAARINRLFCERHRPRPEGDPDGK